MSVDMALNGPAHGLSDSTIDGQAIFRCTLDAMAHPGRLIDLPDVVASLPPVGMAERGLLSLALTLIDADTSVWLDDALQTEPVKDYLRFHCGAPIVDKPTDAAFALVAEPAKLVPLWSFDLGTADYPDRSTTVLLQVAELGNRADGVRLTGPGIETSTAFSAFPLSTDFWKQALANNSFFPLGIDVMFVTNRQVAALPRSTAIDIALEDERDVTAGGEH